MTELRKMYWLHTLTPLHVGEGFGIGAIDLPIVRERTTQWPMVPGSAVKGVIADKNEASGDDPRKKNPKLKAAFGMGGENLDNSGALMFTDARIVAIPVHSDYGTFAWVTSQRVLLRLKRDLDTAGLGGGMTAECGVARNTIHTAEGIASELRSPDGTAYLADLDFTVTSCAITKQWAEKLGGWIFADSAWRTEFAKRFAVVHDETFNFFAETGTEVAARVRINPDSKTVARGGLWYEEYLPAESVLAGLVCCDRVFTNHGITAQSLMDEFCKAELQVQIGGKATIGKGRVRCIFGGSNG
jgi:CRISPR-associated protein Cmr4